MTDEPTRRLYVTEEPIGRLRHAARTGEDPLGIADMGHEEAEQAILAALAGLDAAAARRVEAALRGRIGRDGLAPAMDLVTVGLLVHAGLDPLAVAWMAHVHDGLSVMDDGTMADIVSFDGPGRDVATTVAEGMWWSGDGRLRVRGLPDTVTAAAIGRSLRDVVSHPVLDRHPLMVRDSTPANGAFPAQLACRREEWRIVGSGRLEPISDLARVGDLVRTVPR